MTALWRHDTNLLVSSGVLTAPLTLTPLSPLQAFCEVKRGAWDLRFYDAKGEEVSFKVEVFDGREVRRTASGRMLNRGRRYGEFSEVTVELDAPALEVSSLKVITPNKNFRYPIRVEGSQDNLNWLRIAENVSILDYTEEVRVEKKEVTFPPSRYKYYRIRVYDGKGERFEFDKVIMESVTKQKLELVPIPMSLGGWGDDASQKLSYAKASTPFDGLPLGALEIATDTKVLKRRLSLVKTYRTKDWAREPNLVSAEFYRAEAGNSAGTKLTSYFAGERLPSAFFIIIENGDNPPLANVQLKFYAYKHILYIPGGWKPPLRVYLGSDMEGPPSYEFAKFFTKEKMQSAVDLPFPSLSPNPNYKAPQVPLAKRVAKYPLLLYASYALVLPVVLLLVFRGMHMLPSS